MQLTPVSLASAKVIIINVHGKTLPSYAWKHARRLHDKLSHEPVLGEDGQSNGTGKVMVEAPDRNTSIDGLIRDLIDAGFHPVDVGRRLSFNTSTDESHSTLRYTFGLVPKPDQAAREVVEMMFEELGEVAATSLWNVLVHENPFYIEGHPAKGVSQVSIDINGRQSLVRDDGTPEMRWLKKGTGKTAVRVGEHRFPLRPAHFLGVHEGTLTLLVNQEEERAAAERARLIAEHEAGIAQVASAG